MNKPKMSEIIVNYWSSFDKSGAPNGSGLPNWPTYNDKKPEVMHFAAGRAQAGPVVNREGLKALDDYFAWR
jgi:para-nitrobenzyl esterase